MVGVHARCRVLGYALAALDAAVALVLVMQPAALGDWQIEATLIIVVIAAVAGWLIVVE
jgi:hypothetical protein